MSKDYLKIIAIYFVAGIVTAYFLPKDICKYHLMIFAIGLIFLVLSILRIKNYFYYFIILLFLIGVWRFAVYYPLEKIELSQGLNNEKVHISGALTDFKKDYEYSGSWWLRIHSIEKRNVLTAKINASLYLPHDLDLQINDLIEMDCLVRNSDDSRYYNYLMLNNVYLNCAKAYNIKFLQAGKPSILESIRTDISKIFNKSIGPPYAGLAKALLLADKSDLDKKEQEIFSKSGISHMLAISGLHIVLWMSILYFILFGIGLKREYVGLLTLFIIWVYVIFIGFPMSAWRAAIMLSFFIFAFLFKRYYLNMRSLIVSAFVILIFSPLAWRYDIGFQLSFLALSGIIMFYPRLMRLVSGYRILSMPIIRSAVKIIIVTICAQILTWPIISFNFKVFSLVSVLTNLAVIWLLPAILILLLTGLLLYAIAPFMSVFVFKITAFIFFYIEFISNLLVQLPYAHFETGANFIIYFSYYLVILIYLLYYDIVKKQSIIKIAC